MKYFIEFPKNLSLILTWSAYLGHSARLIFQREPNAPAIISMARAAYVVSLHINLADGLTILVTHGSEVAHICWTKQRKLKSGGRES